METVLALAVATAILVAIPGPNVLLIVAISLRFGLQSGFLTVIGTTLGVAAQLALVVIGMAAIVEAAAAALIWIKWAGVIYLLWLGIRTWQTPVTNLDDAGPVPTVFWRACLIAASNPKTLFFNAAFIPQFVGADPSTPQLMLVAAVFLAILFAGDLLWALFASSARSVLFRHARHRNHLAGALYLAVATALAGSRAGDS